MVEDKPLNKTKANKTSTKPDDPTSEELKKPIDEESDTDATTDLN